MIDAQTYHYFTIEAPELLNNMEQEILGWQEGTSNINSMHTMMRYSHNLKGIAATLDFKTIKQVAESLEEIFRAICKPDFVLDSEVRHLLCQAYQSLKTVLTAKIQGIKVDEEEIIETSTQIFSFLQERLGDFFQRSGELPSMADLGFNTIQTLFEMSIAPELEHTKAALAKKNSYEVASILEMQSQVFLGIAQATGLTGFGAIASATLAALQAHPEEALTIAEIALADFSRGQAEIFSGNSQTGGSPSERLKQLALMSDKTVETPAPLELVENLAMKDLQELIDSTLEAQKTPTEITQLAELFAEVEENVDGEEQKSSLPPSFMATVKNHGNYSSTNTIKFNMESLQQLDRFGGELLTNHQQQLYCDEQIQTILRQLFKRLHQLQASLEYLPEEAMEFAQPMDGQEEQWDNLELQQYHPIHISIQSLHEQTREWEKDLNKLKQLQTQGNQLRYKQSQLLSNSRSVLRQEQKIPIATIFSSLPQLVKQLEKQAQKSIAIHLRGSEVLIDKTVAERLDDILLHLLRNAAMHGIETPQRRQQQKKSSQGQIEINAYHRADRLIVEVKDDGKGIDFAQIRLQAVEQGLTSRQAIQDKSESELVEYLFHRGFSSSSSLENLAGIGLDEVRREILALQGSVVVDTESGKGTSFSLQIPLHLNISKLILCQVHRQVYSLPINSLERVLLAKPEEIKFSSGLKLIAFEQEFIPVYSLAELLSNLHEPIFNNSQPDGFQGTQPLLIVPHREKLIALQVEEIIDEQELVIRSLTKMSDFPTYIDGGAILADERLVLVINIPALLEQYFQPSPNSDVEKTSAMVLQSSSSLSVQETPTLEVASIAIQAQTIFPDLSSKRLSKSTVMIIDDSLTLRHALALTLERAGYQVIHAGDGHEALEKLENISEINLIICDIEMPRMNGFEFLSHRAKKKKTEIPVIMLSSRASEKHRHIAARLGCAAYMTKPYREEQLLMTIKNLLPSAK